jgi:hypothetical protein
MKNEDMHVKIPLRVMPDAGESKSVLTQPLTLLTHKKKALQAKCLRGLFFSMGLGRVELPTSRLSGVRSNHLSYRPLHTAPEP